MSFYKTNTYLISKRTWLLSFLFIPLVLMLHGCGEKIEDFSGFIKSEVTLLLSDNSEKNWIRLTSEVNGQPMEGGCIDSLVYQFTFLENKKDTLGLVFVQPRQATCTDQDFKDVYPEIWKVDSAFCAKKPGDCKHEEGYYLAGSWFISDPFIENDKVHEVIIKNSFDSLVYHINNISSVNLELTTIKVENSMTEKFVAE